MACDWPVEPSEDYCRGKRTTIGACIRPSRIGITAWRWCLTCSPRFGAC